MKKITEYEIYQAIQVNGNSYELFISASNEIAFRVANSRHFNPHFWHDDAILESVGDLLAPQTAWPTLLLVKTRLVQWIERARPPYFAFSATNIRRQRIYQHLITKNIHRLSATYEVFEDGLHFTFIRVGD